MTTSQQQQSIDTFAWLRMLGEKRTPELCRQIISVLNWYGDQTQGFLDAAAQQQLNDLMNLLFFIIAHPSFEVPDDLAVPFIQLNRVLSNLTAMSCFKTTDTYLEIIKLQANNLVRMLALYSARNTVRLDMRVPFQVNPHLASIWYIQVAQAFHAGLPSENVCRNLAEHFAVVPENLVPLSGMQEIFFGSTYANPGADRLAKERVNQSIQRHAAHIQVANRPDPRKIALLSAHWRPVHSVYRTFYDFAKALKPHYHLTLFNLGNHMPQETSLFDEVRIVHSTHGIPDVSALLQNDFQLLYYPDIGMSDESVFLANLRLAPIQVTTIGHSVSTFGAKIDYFISGSGVEPQESPERNYSERLVLLPGMGCTHKAPTYPRPVAALEPSTNPIVINCPWAGQKINFPFLKTVAALLKSCRRPVRLQIFESGATLHKNDFLPFKLALAALILPEQCDVIINLPYDKYMAQLQRAHFALDSFHFGGCNTVSDSLYLGIPMLCRAGDRWYNRIGPHMLRLAGVPELAVDSERDYLQTADRLIHDDGFRVGCRTRLQQASLADTIYGTRDAAYFKSAIDMLIERHTTLQRDVDRTPIRIARS